MVIGDDGWLGEEMAGRGHQPTLVVVASTPLETATETNSMAIAEASTWKGTGTTGFALIFLLLSFGLRTEAFVTRSYRFSGGDADRGPPTSLAASSSNQQHRLSRRDALAKGIAAGGSVLSLPTIPQGAHADSASLPQRNNLLSNYDPNDFKSLPSYGRSVFPPPFLPPINKATYRYSLGRDCWALEQLIAFANVTASIRTNVIRESDGLWVCGPLWPTEEYCALLDELGPVKHVVLPTNALEHKAAMAQFVAKYPEADVWISPGQYGPFGQCGIVTDDMDESQVAAIVKRAQKTMGYRVDGILPVKASSAHAGRQRPTNMWPAWSELFDIEVLCVELPQNAGPVSECAFIHHSSKTLVVTDAVICVPPVPDIPIQPIFGTYFNQASLSDQTFWPRTVLQAVFLPLRTETKESTGICYPGYEALTSRLVRAPILRAFADARAPESVRGWVDRISGKTDFDRIVTAHFASPINAGPALFCKAFAHLDQSASLDKLALDLPPIACTDWSTLNTLNSFIDENNLGAPVVYDFQKGCISE